MGFEIILAADDILSADAESIRRAGGALHPVDDYAIVKGAHENPVATGYSRPYIGYAFSLDRPGQYLYHTNIDL